MARLRAPASARPGGVVRVVGRRRRHRQHLARARIHHDGDGALRVALRHARRQRALGDERQVAIDGQHHVAAGWCSARRPRLSMAMSRPSASRIPCTDDDVPRSCLIQRQLDPVQAVPLRARVPHDRRRQRPVGIEAARLARERDAGQPQRLHRRHLVGRHLALDPGEEPPLPELLLQVGAVEPQDARQPARGVARVGELARVAVDRIDVGRRRQLGAVAVEDAAAARRQLDLAQVLLFRHAAQPVRVAHLQRVTRACRPR